MVKRKNSILYFLICFCLINNLSAQKRNLIIDGGIGYSLMPLAINYLFNSGVYSVNSNPAYQNPPSIQSRSPVYAFAIDYLFTKKSNVTASICYQSIKYLPYYIIDSAQQPEIISRVNISLSYLYNILKIDDSTRIELNIGAKVGLSLWQDKAPSEMNPHYLMLKESSFSVLSYQILLVFRYFPFIKYTDFQKNIGIHIEYGMGSPFILEGGLSYIFN